MRQNIIWQIFMLLNNFLFNTKFGGRKREATLIFNLTCTWDKKLWCGLVRDKNFGFCLVSCPQVCHVPRIILQSNIVQLKLSYPLFYNGSNRHLKLIPRGVLLMVILIDHLQVMGWTVINYHSCQMAEFKWSLIVVYKQTEINYRLKFNDN